MSKIDYLSAALANLQLRANADTRHDDAEEMFGCYGRHISTENAGDVEIQAVNTEWLRDGWDNDRIAAALIEADSDLSRDEAVELANMAKRVWDDMVAIEQSLAEAVDASARGDLEACVDALRAAGRDERAHGDDPSTSDLAARLLEPRTAYRVYEAPDGCDSSFCGEYDTLEAAQEAAEKEPAGLARSDWGTARAAGHVAGMTAPDGGEEDDEPESWHGSRGWHCVVRVTYQP